jgi:hypothetical protein
MLFDALGCNSLPRMINRLGGVVVTPSRYGKEVLLRFSNTFCSARVRYKFICCNLNFMHGDNLVPRSCKYKHIVEPHVFFFSVHVAQVCT